jgi:high-affinity nickel-transport protein
VVSLLAVIGVGFVLGMRHATDPDHVIAVTTIVSRQRSILRAGLIGILWGIGHTLTILFVGAAIILFNIAIPARLGLTMELAVGVMLIFLGVLNLTGVTQWVTNRFMPAHSHGEINDEINGEAIHTHSHAHGENVHAHIHGHNPEVHPHFEQKFEQKPVGGFQNALARFGLYQMLRPLLIGIVHGLAGSAAVALLVLATIRDPRWAILYLLVFGVGTIAGMMLITMVIAAPFAYTGKRFANLNRGLAVASGLVSVAFGLFITFQIGFVDGLFTANPQWTPH